jgi:hypothetical protein
MLKFKEIYKEFFKEFVVGLPMDEIFPSGSEWIATRFLSSFFA